MSDRLECEKTELVLGVNVFNQPAEQSGAKAWGTLVANLAFMTPGAMPTDPEMGVDIQKYEFSFIEDVSSEIEEKMRSQISTYLPDIPLESVEVTKELTETGEPILLIKLIFDAASNEDQFVVIAAEKSNTIINFAVV